MENISQEDMWPKMRYTENQDVFEQPNHYKGFVIEPIEFIMSNNMGFCEGNVVKYVSRYKNKGDINDLEKARDYIDRLIKKHDGQV